MEPGLLAHTFTANQDLRYVDRTFVIEFTNYFDKEGQWEFYVEAQYKEFEEKVLSVGVIANIYKLKNL